LGDGIYFGSSSNTDKLRFWLSNISMWPRHRDYKTFKIWFTVEFHPIIVDLEDNDYIIKGYEI